jgi:hypothetical protein
VVDAANEFQTYAVRFQKSVKEARSRLSPRAELELYRIISEISEDPDRFPNRVERISRAGDLLYKNLDPPLEITYRVDAIQKIITIMDVVERAVVGALVVVSYSHKDEKWRNELRKFLKPLERQKRLRIWDDTAIDAGEQWREEIKRALGSANVAILLMSADFLASDFISQQELSFLVDRAKKKDGGMQLLWIAVRPSGFELEPDVESIQALNDPSRPLSKLEKPAWETELAKVCRKILHVLEEAAVQTTRDDPSKEDGGVAKHT